MMKNKNKTTKFPVARIKKIMQKDEEVGKVAQATPIVISKALELFLNLIIDESNKVTEDRGSKKVEAYHLKHAVETTEMLDFLKELVEAVPDPSAGGTVDLESENTETKKKRGKGKRAPAAAASGEPATKKRRRKKGDAEQVEAVVPVPKADPDRAEDQDDDAEMNEYDDDAGGRHNGTYRPKSPSDDEGWDGGKPFIPRRR